MTDLPFRRVPQRFRACLVVSEMVEHDLSLEGNPDTGARAAVDDIDPPVIQSVGRELDRMARLPLLDYPGATA